MNAKHMRSRNERVLDGPVYKRRVYRCIRSAAALWQEYVDWKLIRGEQALDRRKFAQLLAARGFEKGKVGHARTWTWFGLALVTKVATTPAGQTA